MVTFYIAGGEQAIILFTQVICTGNRSRTQCVRGVDITEVHEMHNITVQRRTEQKP